MGLCKTSAKWKWVYQWGAFFFFLLLLAWTVEPWTSAVYKYMSLCVYSGKPVTSYFAMWEQPHGFAHSPCILIILAF